MAKLICANVFVPLRINPSHKSEQGSQILFGEKYIIIDRSVNWVKIRNDFDGYEGWMDGDHHLYFEDEENDKVDILATRTVFITDNGMPINLEAGSVIYNFNKTENSFSIGNSRFTCKSEVILIPMNESVSQTAQRFLNCPYLWGGRTSGGMDCSGLTQLVYKLHGYNLPRDSFMQADVGVPVSFLEEANEGDLLFFDDDKGNITHVGLFMGSRSMIHCSGKVRIDRIDHQGIYIQESGRYTHRLRIIKRLKIED